MVEYEEMAKEILPYIAELASKALEKLKSKKKLTAEEWRYLDRILTHEEFVRLSREMRQEYREGTESLRQEYREGRKEIKGGIEGLRKEYREGTDRIIAKIGNGRTYR